MPEPEPVTAGRPARGLLEQALVASMAAAAIVGFAIAQSAPLALTALVVLALSLV